jgi:AraC-like DNA-binding protein
MVSTAADFTRIRFSTDALPARDRLAIWHDVFGRQMVKVQFEADPDVPFFRTATLCGMPGLSLAFSRSSACHTFRTRSLMADGVDDLIFTAILEGAASGSLGDREPLVTAGDGLLMPCTEVLRFSYSTTSRFITAKVTRKAIAAMVKDPEAALFLPIRRTDELKLLTSYVAGVEDGVMLTSPELRHAFATHVQDLIALAIGATRDSTQLARGRGLRAARLAAVKADIAQHLGAEEFTVAAAAARQHVTPRYIQRLFEEEGTTFSAYALHLRLVRTHRLLTDPRCAGWSIIAIAFEAGFNNVSHFNRAFRRLYGESPSDVRAAARRGDRR